MIIDVSGSMSGSNLEAVKKYGKGLGEVTFKSTTPTAVNVEIIPFDHRIEVFKVKTKE